MLGATVEDRLGADLPVHRGWAKGARCAGRGRSTALGLVVRSILNRQSNSDQIAASPSIYGGFEHGLRDSLNSRSIPSIRCCD